MAAEISTPSPVLGTGAREVEEEGGKKEEEEVEEEEEEEEEEGERAL